MERLHSIGRLLVVGLLACIAAACHRRPSLLEERVSVQDIPFIIKISGAQAGAASVAGTARGMLQEILRQSNRRDKNSDIAKINRLAGSIRLPVGRDLYKMLELAANYSQMTEGTFDLTAMPLRLLWGFDGGRIPEEPLAPELVRASLQGVGYKNVRLDNGSIALESPYTQVFPSVFATAYAMDLSIVKLRARASEDLLLQADHLSRCLGMEAERKPWRYDIPHPLSNTNSIGTINLPPGWGACTARLYERSVTIAGRRYGHIINPATGWPAQGTLSATVISPTVSEATALAYSLVVSGREKGLMLLRRFPRSHVLLVPDAPTMELWTSDGMVPYLAVEPSLSKNVFAMHVDTD